MNSNKRLEEKIVMITGAGGFLGKFFCRSILETGGKVIALENNLDALKNMEVDFKSFLGKNLLIFNCDITDEFQVLDTLKRAINKIGIPNCLVNNAAINSSVESGVSKFTRIENLTYKDWKHESDIGLWGALVCSKIFGNMLVENNLGGSIVNIASEYAITAPNQSVYIQPGIESKNQPVKPITYSIIKHGIIGLTKYFATYWGSTGIRSNSITPGSIFNNQNSEFIKRKSTLIPMNRLGMPEEVCGALIYLLSDESSFTNGSNIVVDGGATIW